MHEDTWVKPAWPLVLRFKAFRLHSWSKPCMLSVMRGWQEEKGHLQHAEGYRLLCQQWPHCLLPTSRAPVWLPRDLRHYSTLIAATEMAHQCVTTNTEREHFSDNNPPTRHSLIIFAIYYFWSASKISQKNLIGCESSVGERVRTLRWRGIVWWLLSPHPGLYVPRQAFKAPQCERRGEATLFIEAWTEMRAVFTRLSSRQYQGPFHVIMQAHLELMLSGIVKGP